LFFIFASDGEKWQGREAHGSICQVAAVATKYEEAAQAKEMLPDVGRFICFFPENEGEKHTTLKVLY
jgi:hypothetical protein